MDSNRALAPQLCGARATTGRDLRVTSRVFSIYKFYFLLKYGSREATGQFERVKDLVRLIMAFSVHGKTAIVTGAGSGIFTCSIQLSLVLLISSPTGINLAFARLLLSRGCNVLFVDLALRPEAEETIEKYKITRVGTLGRA